MVRTYSVLAGIEQEGDALAKILCRFCDSVDLGTEYKNACFPESDRQAINIVGSENTQISRWL